MSYQRSKFLDPATLDEAIRQIAELASLENVRLALIGGYAMQFYGSPRLTGDVDMAADGMLGSLPPGEPLSFGGFRTRSPNGVPVDLVLRHDEFRPLYEEAIAQARTLPGAHAPVVTPEHLAAMKMVAGRNGKDDADLEFLIASGVVDLIEARKIIHRFLGPYAAREFDRTVELVQWKKDTGKL
ncbi:MAG: hypothetical protein JW797_06595 [Bradymonadales bacterium]|nr:hypothetical protein [Bradymonadales bacterium]